MNKKNIAYAVIAIVSIIAVVIAGVIFVKSLFPNSSSDVTIVDYVAEEEDGIYASQE